MERISLIILLGLLATSVAFAEAYTWTDENGVVHYSDRPNPGAKVIELPESNAPRAQPTARPAQQQIDEEPAVAQAFSYESIAIDSPAAEETLWNIGAQLNVSVTVTPALRAGDQVRAYFDGTPQTVSGTSFVLQEVYRGVHNLQVEVIDESGTLMIRSRPNRFYVQQSTVNTLQ